MNVGDSLINTDFLRVARQRIFEGQPHELYFNYLLMKLLTEVHSCTDVSVTSAFQDVHKDVEVLTGVVYCRTNYKGSRAKADIYICR